MNKKHKLSNKLSMKNRRKRTLWTAGALLLLMIVNLITLAFFASRDEVTNRFNATNLDILLTEPHWNPAKAKNVVPEQVLDKDPYVSNIDEVDAYVFLKVTVPYATVQLEQTTGESKGSDVSGGMTLKMPLYKFGKRNVVGAVVSYEYDSNNDLDQLVNEGWQRVGGIKDDTTNQTFTYVYAHVSSSNLIPLIKDHTTQYPLFDKIKVVNFDETSFKADPGNTAGIDRTKSAGIKVEAFGIQTNYILDSGTSNDPLNVWKVIEPDWPDT